MAVKIIEVAETKHFKDFVNVQFEIYKGNNFWVPPIKKDEIKAIQSIYNPAFRFSLLYKLFTQQRFLLCCVFS